jgi:hypothetical protein
MQIALEGVPVYLERNTAAEKVNNFSKLYGISPFINYPEYPLPGLFLRQFKPVHMLTTSLCELLLLSRVEFFFKKNPDQNDV